MTMTLDTLVRAHGRSARDVLNERTRAATSSVIPWRMMTS